MPVSTTASPPKPATPSKKPRPVASKPTPQPAPALLKDQRLVLAATADDGNEMVYFDLKPTDPLVDGLVLRNSEEFPVSFWSYVTRMPLDHVMDTDFHKNLWTGHNEPGWMERFYDRSEPFLPEELTSLGLPTPEMDEEQPEPAPTKTKSLAYDVKAPQDVLFDVPQERITGDVMRGYGPRRGNLEKLLRYWRPIMRKPGGFRRCLAILADHPELAPHANICAWLHHETTGLWPNEGCHHPGMKNCRKKIRGVVNGSRFTDAEFNSRLARLASQKKDANQTPPMSSSAYANFRLLRVKSGEGRRISLADATGSSGIAVKAGLVNSNSRISRAAQAAASMAVPGDMSDVRRPVRSTIYETLTPGGGNDRRNLIRRGLGRSKRNQLRCPPGFENGGQFTDKSLSTCGLRLFDLPGFGLVPIGRSGDGRNVGGGAKPLSGVAIEGSDPRGGTTIERDANVVSVDSGPQAVQAEGTAAPQGPGPTAADGIDISRIALINPTGEFDAGKRDEAIAKAIKTAVEANSSDFGRLVRRDGTMLDNVVPILRLADVRNSDDMEQGFLVTTVTDGQNVGVAEFQVMSAGLDGVVMATPDGKGFIRIERSGAGAGSIRGMRRRWGTLMRDQDPQLPGTALDALVQEAGKKLKLSIQYPGMEDPMGMVSIVRGGATRQVRRWVYVMFLSDEAPMRPESLKPWGLKKDDTK